MINQKTIENAIFDLCKNANTILPNSVFKCLQEALAKETSKDAKQAIELILKNAKIAFEKQMPLCQDTGIVIVFVKIPNKIEVENLNTAINNGVKKAYKNCFFRKSTVKNAFFDRTNTKTNLPIIIYPEFSKGRNLELEVLIKGGGAENMSQTAMLSPTSDEKDIIDFVVKSIQKAGSKPCPPLFLGIGMGGTMEYAGILSKKALCLDKNIDEKHQKLAEKIKKEVNSLNIGVAGFGGCNTVLDVKILSDFLHIASLPVALTINCHSSRHAKCSINKDNKISRFSQNLVKNFNPKPQNVSDYKKIKSSDISALKKLKIGDKVLLSGEIYTARDAAHKRLTEMIKNGRNLPFELENSMIFYAGPAPAKPNSVIGSIGPTTSSRMDKYATLLYDKGVLATIGKGERSNDIKSSIKKNNAIYFTVIGGIASLLADKICKKITGAFEDLGTEAIFKLEIKALPVCVGLL